jgi:hypothetical protein
LAKGTVLLRTMSESAVPVRWMMGLLVPLPQSVVLFGIWMLALTL